MEACVARLPSLLTSLFLPQALLNHNATVYMFCRSRARAEAAIADLKTQTGREAHFVECDLGDLRSVKRAAEDFLR